MKPITKTILFYITSSFLAIAFTFLMSMSFMKIDKQVSISNVSTKPVIVIDAGHGT